MKIADIAAQLCSGAWLTRERVHLAASILLAAEILILAFLVAGTHGWIVPLEHPTTTDFVSFYAAGSLADAGTPALAYNHATHLAAEEAVTGPGVRYQFFNYPPVFLLLCAALAPLPYLVAFVLFESATLVLFLFVASRILGDRSGTALIALAAFPIVFWNFGLGQNAFLTASLFGAATLLIDTRPICAGLLFGALCLKPQLAVLVPFALAAGARWRAFAAAALSSLALVLLSLALFGFEAWRAFLQAVTASPAMYQSGRILFAGMANPFGAVRLLGADAPMAYVIQAVFSLTAAAIVVATWRRKLPLPTRMAVLTAGSLVAAPLSLLYDLMLGAVAAAWLIRGNSPPAAVGWEITAFAVAYLVLLDGLGIGETLHVPVFPLVALALFAIAARRAWREAAIAETEFPRGRTGESRDRSAAPSRSASPPR